MLMAMFTKAIGRTTKLMDSANITTPMERAMKGTGARINSTGMARRHGLTVHATRGSIRMARRTDMVSSTGLTGPHTRDSSLTTTFMGSAFTRGLTADNIMVTGLITRCMDVESSHGQTVGAMMGSTSTIANKDTEYSPGPMAVATKAAGLMENSMVSAFTILLKAMLKKENGLKASVYGGSLSKTLVETQLLELPPLLAENHTLHPINSEDYYERDFLICLTNKPCS